MNFFPSDSVTINSNVIYYWSFCESYSGIKWLEDKEYFPAGYLPKELGLEIFTVANINFNYINFFISYAVYFPGARYSSPLLNPLDYFDAYYFLNSCVYSYKDNPNDKSFCGSAFEPDTTKFNPVYLFNAGFSYLF